MKKLKHLALKKLIKLAIYISEEEVVLEETVKLIYPGRQITIILNDERENGEVLQ